LLPGTQEFFDQLSDLASSIKRQLEAMDRAMAGAAAREPRRGPVFVAISQDCNRERETLLRYLDNVGIDALPRLQYPLGGEAFREALAQDLAKAKLFVQLLGADAGWCPPDLPEGYTRHQAAAAKAAGLPVMQWRSTALSVEDIGEEGYRALITGATVTASTLQQFQDDVRKRIETPPPAPKRTDDGEIQDGARPHVIVFVHAEKSDQTVADRIRDELGTDYSVFALDPSASAASVQEAYGERLKACTALLLVYGAAGPNWIEKQMLQTIKTLGRNLPYGAVCLGPPPENPHVKFRVPRFRELDCRDPDGGWRTEPIREFMAQFG
jgi:hypothetical protein